MLSLWESLSVSSLWKPCKIELSGINERILPLRPELPPSLFAKVTVFTAAFLPWHGSCQDLLGPTGNSQAFPFVWLIAESNIHPFYPSVSVKVIRQFEAKKKKMWSMCARVSLVLITSYRKDVSRPGNAFKAASWRTAFFHALDI